MDTKNLSLLFKTSLLAASMSMVVGCSDNPIPTTTTTTTDVTSEIDSTVETAAKDGTVVTVADGYGKGCDVTSGTLTAVEVDDALGQYIFAGDPTEAIEAKNCIDAHTGVALANMSAPAPTASDNYNLDKALISPVTTMVQAMVAEGSTKEEAEARTSELIGVPVEKLHQNPITAANDGDDSLVKAAVKLVSIAKSLEKAGTTDGLVAMAKAVRTKTATNAKLDDAIQDDKVIETLVPDANKRAQAKTIVKVVADAVDAAAGGNAGTDLINAIAKVAKKVALTDANTLSSTTASNLSQLSQSETVSSSGLETTEVTEESSALTNVVKKMVSRVKADPEKATFLNAAAKKSVTEKSDELKTVDATAASKIKASAAEEVAKSEQDKVDAKVALAVESDVKAELEKAAAAAKAAAEAAAKAAAEAAAAADAAAAEAAAAKAVEEANKATTAVSSGATAGT